MNFQNLCLPGNQLGLDDPLICTRLQHTGASWMIHSEWRPMKSILDEFIKMKFEEHFKI